MSQAAVKVEKCIKLSVERSARLHQMAQVHGIDEGQIVEKALDILFTVTDLFDERAEQQGWSFLSEDSLHRVWDNEDDAAYNNWSELYNVRAW